MPIFEKKKKKSKNKPNPKSLLMSNGSWSQLYEYKTQLLSISDHVKIDIFVSRYNSYFGTNAFDSLPYSLVDRPKKQNFFVFCI